MLFLTILIDLKYLINFRVIFLQMIIQLHLIPYLMKNKYQNIN